MAITVKFIADIANWVSGLGKTDESIQENQDSLAELMVEATKLGLSIGKTTDEIASDFHDAFGTPVDQAKKAIEAVAKEGDKTERELERNFDQIGDSAKDAGRDVGTHLDDGFDRAKSGMDDFKDEAGGTAREVAASFDGSAESIAGGFQEIAANAFAGFGPAGAAAGLAAAAGIGLLTKSFQDAEDRRKALEEKASDLAQAYIDAGTTVLDTMTIASRISGLITSTDPQDKQNVEDLTSALGDRALALRVLAGDTAALATAQGIQTGQEKELAALVAQGGVARGDLAQRTNELGRSTTDLNRILSDQSDAQKMATQDANAYSDSLKQIINDTGDATLEVDEFGNQLYTLPSGATVVIDAKTGQASTDVSKFKGDVDTIPDEHVTSVKVAVDDSAWRDWTPFEKLGIVAAVPKTGTGTPWKQAG